MSSLKKKQKGLVRTATSAVKWTKQQTLNLIAWGTKKGGSAFWVVSMTCVEVVLPLLIEVEREASVIQLEQLQANELIKQGYSVQQVQNLGLSVETDPKVLSRQ